jgi:hypothetical protein
MCCLTEGRYRAAKLPDTPFCKDCARRQSFASAARPTVGSGFFLLNARALRGLQFSPTADNIPFTTTNVPKTIVCDTTIVARTQPLRAKVKDIQWRPRAQRCAKRQQHGREGVLLGKCRLIFRTRRRLPLLRNLRIRTRHRHRFVLPAHSRSRNYSSRSYPNATSAGPSSYPQTCPSMSGPKSLAPNGLQALCWIV